ncbi:MAG: ABC transporter ATP-binding protein [Acidobacteriota bacterium]|nr:MAG: ABC transporter ATP-binding protein [Acidobacteriota bacterium]
MTAHSDSRIAFENVSKFYGEVLGVNRVQLSIEPGITSLVGPNGSGKTTLMNLMTGLLRPTDGRIRVRGIAPDDPERLFKIVGYCTQHDTFPRGLTGFQFLSSYLLVHGLSREQAHGLAMAAIERVRLNDAAHRKIAAYSKGMRQRIKLAQAICHDPSVLVLDEPLNGLDPMARAETIDLFRELATEGKHLILSSHILHEVDLISDSVILLNEGYVVAEGDIRGVRSEMESHPLQIFIRCEKPEVLAAKVFAQDAVVEVRIHDDRRGLLVSTRNPDSFYLLLNQIVLAEDLEIEHVTPADENVQAVYRYLIGGNGEKR